MLYKKKSLLSIILFAVAVQFILIVIINYTKANGELLDYDSSLAIRHAVEMWKNGLFLDDWNYLTSLEIDCAAFLQLLFI